MGLKKGEKTRAQLMEEVEKYKKLYEEKDQKLISRKYSDEQIRKELSNIIQHEKYNAAGDYRHRTDNVLSWMEIAAAIGELKGAHNLMQGEIINLREINNYLNNGLQKIKNINSPEDPVLEEAIKILKNRGKL